MRDYPHKPDAENVALNLESSLKLIDSWLQLQKAGQVKPNPQFFQNLAEQQVAAACESYALEKPMTAVKAVLKDASRNLASVTHRRTWKRARFTTWSRKS